MKKILFLYIIWCTNYLQAQNQDSLSEKQLETVVISANKVAEEKRFVAQSIQVLTATRIAQLNAQTTADLLAQSGSVLVQRSQQGGGSPILRGFEASRVLLVIDGVRMNNLIYRSGHLQNVMSTDQAILSRLEILQGPASTVYGSDALGGVVHLMTKNPYLSQKEGGLFSGNAYMRYGSVNHEKTGHLDFNMGFKKFASLTSFTYSDFGDLKMGKKPQALDTLWGLRNTYQQFVNGRDSLMKNENPYVQKASGYKQYDVLQKFLFQTHENISHLLNFQYSTSSNVPRYDRLTDPRGTGLAQGDWYYGPQKRFMGCYILAVQNLGFFNSMRLNMNFQDVVESRHTRGFGSANRTDRLEKAKIAGANLDFQRKKNVHDLRMGLDFQYGTVTSTAQAVNMKTGAISPASTRYPDGDNVQSNIAAYFTHTYKINDKLTLNDGLRVANTHQKSTFLSQTFYKFPFTETKQNVLGWSGNLGLIFQPKPIFKMSLLGSSGYRVPNVDDLSKVFDTQRGSVVIPNVAIKPEKTYNLDLGFAFNVTDKMVWETSFFTTAYRDAIVVGKFQYNGQDSILYDGVKSAVLAPQNKQKAKVKGFTTSVKAFIGAGVSLVASYNYTQGRVINTDGKETRLDHIPPAFGRFAVRYAKEKFDSEFYVNFNTWKRIDDYLLKAEDNEQYATKEGMPAWWTMNVRASYDLPKGLKIQRGVENIADIQYRVFASGIHAGGRNVYGTLRYRF